MAFNIRSIMGRNKQQQPQQALPPLPGGAPPMPAWMANKGKPLPPLPKQFVPKPSAKPDIPLSRSGRVDITFDKTGPEHLSAMADDQLVNHWQTALRHPDLQNEKGIGADINHPMFKDAHNELEKRGIQPFLVDDRGSTKPEFDSTGKITTKFMKKDPKTGSTIPRTDDRFEMVSAKGKGRVDPRRNSPPPLPPRQ